MFRDAIFHKRPFMALALAVCVGGLAGCAWFQSTTAEIYYARQLKRANEAFQQDRYALAATLYESLSDRYPSTKRREDMIMNQAMALYKLKDYHDARNVYLNYLQEFPEGRYVEEARDRLDKINVFLTAGRRPSDRQIEQAKEDLAKLRALRKEYPYSPDIAYALGNLYYEMGDYEEAVRFYYEAQQLNAAYKEKELISQRMLINNQGEPVPMTREAQQQYLKNENPLVLFNLNDYKASQQGQYITGNPDIYFCVTGLIRNQSDTIKRDVTIEVRFLNVNHEIQDVTYVRLGNLAPQEVRAFRATATKFDNIYNIAEYECIPRWRQ